MRKLPVRVVLVLVALACGGSTDDYPPLLGDCSDCTKIPLGGGTSSGGPSSVDGGVGDAVGDVFSPDDVFEEVDIIDVGVTPFEAGM
jgi:hypothetical protein